MGQVKLLGENDDLVRIMTVHKSKGLEFPMVVLAGCCRRLNSVSYTHLDVYKRQPGWLRGDVQKRDRAERM